MLNIMPHLECLGKTFPKQFVRLLGIVCQSMLCCKGRITMRGLSRWSGKGGSYRSIQRLYGSTVNWLQINWLFFKTHRLKENEVYLLTGDETTVTKSGKSTHGLGRFYSSIYGRAVKGLNFLSLCLVGVSSRQSAPLLMEAMDAGMKKETQVKKKPTKGKKKKKKATGSKGRPKGSKNKNRSDPELTPYLKWIQKQIKETLAMIGNQVAIAFFVYDGAFGNNPCLQMVKACGLSMISKLQCNAALWYPYEGEYSGRGPRRKYGDKVDCRNIPGKYLKSSTIKDGVEERIYQIKVWHKIFRNF